MKKKAVWVLVLLVCAGGWQIFDLINTKAAAPEVASNEALDEITQTLEAMKSKLEKEILLEREMSPNSARLKSLEDYSDFLEEPRAKAIIMLGQEKKLQAELNQLLGIEIGSGQGEDHGLPSPVGDYYREWPPKDPSYMEPRGDGLPPDAKQEWLGTPPPRQPVFPD